MPFMKLFIEMLARQVDLEMNAPVAITIGGIPPPEPRKPLLEIVKEMLSRFGQVFKTAPASTSQGTK